MPVFKRDDQRILSKAATIIVKTMEHIIHFRTNCGIGVSPFNYYSLNLASVEITELLTSYLRLYMIRPKHWSAVIVSTVYSLIFVKMFDSVPHHRFLLKLQSLGVSGGLFDWTKCFLTTRS